MKASGVTLVAISALLAVSHLSTAATIYVPWDQPTIQAGIDAASYDDTVIVACGTYYEHDIVLKSGVALRSETGLPDCVTIDAQQEGRVLYCANADSLTSIVGFTITGGVTDVRTWGAGMHCSESSPRLTSCTFAANIASSSRGGGIYCQSSSPRMESCAFLENEALYGGGIYSASSSLTVAYCTFSDNDAGDYGGGMYCNGGSHRLISCTFDSNTAGTYGGGIWFIWAEPALMSCMFSGNMAWLAAGGVCSYHSGTTFTTCTFARNRALEGGGLCCWESTGTSLTSCTVVNNRGEYYGGGLYCAGSSPSLDACIVAFNHPGPAFYCIDSVPQLHCCDVYGNVGGDWVGAIADQYGVNGNIWEDPLFCGEEYPAGPYRLHSDSPCASGHTPGCGLIGAWGVSCDATTDPTTVEEVTWGSIKAMFR